MWPTDYSISYENITHWGWSDHHLPQKFYFWWWLYSVSKTWETWRQKNPNWFRTLCLSINGLWIAFHWRGRGYHNIHFLLMSKLACVSPMFILQSTNTTSLSIYNKYTIYTYVFILSICIFLSKKFLLIDVVVGILIKLFLCENLCH